MTRRNVCFALIGLISPAYLNGQPKLGDEEWMRHFNDFVRTFNLFVVALNDGRFDLLKWKNMKAEWKKLDVD